MSYQTPAPQSPEWWLRRLETCLMGRQSQMELMNAYYEGNHPMPFLTKAHDSKMRDEFRQLLADSRTNFMRLVVDVVEERLRVEGFRLSASSDAVADQRSWEIWQANQMDANSQAAFVESLVKGVSYLSVWEADESDYPTIAVEDPLQTIVEYEPGTNFRRRAAALKVWDDDWSGLRRANVFLPDGIYKFQSPIEAPRPAGTRYAVPGDPFRWQPLGGDESWEREAFVPNRVGIVPIVPLRNRPRLLTEGESELSDVYQTQNQINGFVFLLALAGYFGAHRQRWAIGLTLMEDQHGRPKEPFDVAIDKLWATENPEAKFGEFSQTSLDGYIAAIEQKILHLAVTSRTPRHYLIQQGQSPSGDAIQSAESGLVKKVERKQRPLGEGLEEAMRLARRFDGADDMPVDSEVVWADAATENEAALTDSVIKQYAAGLLPWEAAQEKLGRTQTEIVRYATMRATDILTAGLTEPTEPDPAWQGQVIAS